MTPRSIRRAAERKARKAELKKLRHQPDTAAVQAAAVQAAPTPISPAQLAANQTNAQKSTGPITPEGKAISARNHLSHGLTQTEANFILLPTESQDDFNQSLAAFQAEWQPATPTEHDLVTRLVTHAWLRRRALRLQHRFLDAEGLIQDEKQFNLYRRYEVQHERAFNKAFSDLARLRTLRLREQNGFESQRRQNEKHELQIRALQHREKLRKLAIFTAEARLALAEGKLRAAGCPETPVQPSETYASDLKTAA